MDDVRCSKVDISRFIDVISIEISENIKLRVIILL